METGYKLTNHSMQTRDGFQWRKNRWRRAGGGTALCAKGCLHYYSSPELAAFMNAIHANIKKPRLFRAEIEGDTLTDGVKSGLIHGRMRLVEELKVVTPSAEQFVYFAVMCARTVLPVGPAPQWDAWAENWISGKDRSARVIPAAAKAAADAVVYAQATVLACKAAYAAAAVACKAAYAAAQAGVYAADVAAQAGVYPPADVAACAAYAADVAASHPAVAVDVIATLAKKALAWNDNKEEGGTK